MNSQDLELFARQLVAPARRLGTIALCGSAIALGVFAWSGLPLLGSLVSSTGNPVESVPAEKLTKKQAEFGALLASSSEGIIAREPWGKVSIGKAKPRDSGPAPVPTKYAGPAIVGLMSDTVWFADGKHIRVGESSEGLSGVTVLEAHPPWSAKVRWMKGEFTVSLFDRDPLKWAQPMTVWSGPPPAPPTPEPPKPGTGPATAVAGGAAPGGPAPAPGAAPAAPPGGIAIPGGIQLPPGAILGGGAPVIIRNEGGGAAVVTTSSAGAPPPPPPPPPDENPEKK